MAEGSGFWSGQTTGDAAGSIFAAPYSDDEFSDILAKMLLNDAASYGFVSPGYGNNLRVQANSPAAMNVILKSGAIFVRGRIYENNADQTLTISTADATNPRLDRVVLRVTFASQTIRPIVKEGVAAATPSLPTLTNDGTVMEIPLATVWVAAAAVSIAEEEVHDERIFSPNLEALIGALFQENLLENSEFLCGIGSRTYPPARWSLVSTPTAILTTTKPAQMPRGNAIQWTADGANEGIQQSVSVKASTAYVLRILYNITAGDVGSIVVTTNAASPSTITRNLRRTGSWLEEYVYYTTEADATSLTVQLRANSSTDIVAFGQALLVEGYNPGPYRMIDPDASMVLLDEIELTGDDTFDFQNIPQTFSSLRIVGRLRTTRAATGDFFGLRINNDSAGNYDAIRAVFYHSSSYSTVETIAGTKMNLSEITGDTGPAGTFSPTVLEIVDYADTSKKHEVVGFASQVLVEATGTIRAWFSGGHYRSTGSGISRLTFIPDVAATFKSGSRMSLYGIK